MVDTRARGTDWKRLLLVSIAIGVGVGIVFGTLNTVFDVSFPPWVLGAVAGTIIGVVVGITRRT